MKWFIAAFGATSLAKQGGSAYDEPARPLRRTP